jgi:hypothetical protein
MIIASLRNIRHVFIFIFPVTFIPFFATGQSSNYWTRSFNEESSLLSGAVVGGGSGPTSIYYNPASISEVKASSFSLNASLFSFEFVNVKNALGDDLNIKMSRGTVEPRFVSYMIKSKRFKNWSFEVAILNNENSKAFVTEGVDERIDILTGIPGNERYFALYQYASTFRDDWIGTGGSVRISDRITLGLSMFVTVKSLNYSQSLDIEAYSINDTILNQNEYEPYYVAAYENSEYLKFNDYRLTFKGGFLYKADHFSFGLCFTTPSLGGIYSDGKRVTRLQRQSNITMPETGEPLPDYVVVDFKEKKDVDVGYRTPFSLAAGFNYYLPDKKRIFYSSFEYFAGLEPYRMVEAEESQDIGPAFVSGDVVFSEWLTYVSGARDVFNAAIGCSWTLKEDLLLMSGFRTDFNSTKKLDYGQFEEYNRCENVNVDMYHITCGLSLNIFGQDIITGLQYTLGHSKGLKQLANLSDPVEYVPSEKLALQGIPNNDMNSWFNAISLYFGASLNFGGEKN